jgi:hypothetical protein
MALVLHAWRKCWQVHANGFQRQTNFATNAIEFSQGSIPVVCNLGAPVPSLNIETEHVVLQNVTAQNAETCPHSSWQK